MNNLINIEIGGEKILAITLFGNNRKIEALQWHQKVMTEHFGLNINYVGCPFPAYSNGFFMNHILKNTIDTPNRPDYYLFIDYDAIFLKPNCMQLIYDIVKNKTTVFGLAQQSNHLKGPNGNIQHAYASQAILCFSSSLYDKLGRPDLDHFNPRSDIAEELTYRTKELGYGVCLYYPSHVVDANCDLDNGMKFGLGNTFGPNLFYHAMQAADSRSVPLFIEKCKEVLDGKIV